MNHHSVHYLVILSCALLSSCSDATEENTPHEGMDQLERQLEINHHKDLLAHQMMPDSTLATFTTDGCSGGLSIGWEYLAEQIDGIREYHGSRPPWEDCCIAHDRLYHTGAAMDATAEDSFVGRKEADLALLDCVLETGDARTAELSREYGVSPETIHTLYSTIAELMYRAVRVGGVPCSGLPWRWGYGWPQCD
jgi:hypothetical protein